MWEEVKFRTNARTRFSPDADRSCEANRGKGHSLRLMRTSNLFGKDASKKRDRGRGSNNTLTLYCVKKQGGPLTISILGWPIELETTLNTIWTLLTGQSKHVNHMHVAYVSFQSVWIVAVGGVFVVWRNRNVKVLKRRDSVLERTRHFRIDIRYVQPPVCHLALTILASIAKHLVTLGMFLNSVRSSSLKM